MLRGEAEQEAERRNREDPQRARYEFYAFDESAGLAADAWDVGARLRRGPLDLRARETPVRPLDSPARTPDSPLPASADEALAPLDSDRPGLFVRGLGTTVVAVGVLWIGTVTALAAFLRPEELVGFVLYLVTGALGLLAIALGIAIRRS